MTSNRRGKAVFVVLIIALIADIIIGLLSSVSIPISKCPASPSSPCLTQIQTGVTTLTFNAGNAGPLNGPTITFNPAYSVAPTIFLSDDVVGSTVGAGTFSENAPAFFQATGTDQMWVNMPAASTEIYGDVLGQHRLTLDWSKASDFDFGMNCDTASSSGTSYITIEYSTAGNAGPFTELSSQQRQPLQNTSNCNNGTVYANSGSFSSIPGAAQIQGVTLAIFGVNGAGVGDTPHFTMLYVEWHSIQSNGAAAKMSYNFQPCATTFCTSESTPTSFFVRGTTSYSTGFSMKVRWIAGILA